MEKKTLYRSEQDKKICGVCGGIAEYFDIDSSIVRVAAVVLVWFWFVGLVAYFAAAIILPTKTEVERRRAYNPNNWNQQGPNAANGWTAPNQNPNNPNQWNQQGPNASNGWQAPNGNPNQAYQSPNPNPNPNPNSNPNPNNTAPNGTAANGWQNPTQNPNPQNWQSMYTNTTGTDAQGYQNYPPQNPNQDTAPEAEKQNTPEPPADPQ